MALPGFVSDNSGRQTAFNDGSWGGPTRGYLISAKNLKSKSFNEVIKRAKDLSKSACQTSTKVPIATDKFLATNDVTHGLRVLREQLFLRLLLTTCRAPEYTLDLESCLGTLRQS
jgi:hypothetical protein